MSKSSAAPPGSKGTRTRSLLPAWRSVCSRLGLSEGVGGEIKLPECETQGTTEIVSVPQPSCCDFALEISGRVWLTYPAVSQSGLVSIHFRFTCPRGDPPGGEFLLIVQLSPGDHTTFRKGVSLQGGELQIALAVNSHLLRNGGNTLDTRLVSPDGEVVWSDMLSFIVCNTSPLALRVAESLRTYGTPLILDGPCDTSQFDFGVPTLNPWFDRDDALDHIHALRAQGRIGDQGVLQLTQFIADGFVILDGLVEPELITQIRNELDDAVDKKIEGYKYGSSQRIPNLHLVYPGVRRLWAHPKILHFLELIFESKPRPCQTLTYIFGSQQDAHQDTIHLTPFPAGYMCGVWVAIDDVKANSGELEVYRGSHRTPRLYLKDTGCPKVTNGDWAEFGRLVVPIWERMISAKKFERIVYRPKAGTVLIWHENLLHGGGVRKDMALSRRSVVSHFFADGAIAFYDSTGAVGNMEPVDRIYES